MAVLPALVTGSSPSRVPPKAYGLPQSTGLTISRPAVAVGFAIRRWPRAAIRLAGQSDAHNTVAIEDLIWCGQELLRGHALPSHHVNVIEVSE